MTSDETAADNHALRLALWQACPHVGKYGDDGEMQCRGADFLRGDAVALGEHVREAFLAVDYLTEPRRIRNVLFEWDFMVRSCRACSGDFPFLGMMPAGWTHRGHEEDCWLVAMFAALGQRA